MTKLVCPFIRFGLADPPVALAGFQADAGGALVVATNDSIGLLPLPAVPMKIVFPVVTAAPTAG